MAPQIDIPGYEIIEKIGEGGMGSVWKARQVSLDRIVAIKTLVLQSPRNEKALERFHLEVRAAGRLKNSGIVQVYDAGELEGYAYCVMEYVEDSTIGDWLEAKGPLSTKHALTIAQGVATALAYAWEHASLIHCDVKPENIMIDHDGTVKVSDLGLARIIGLADSDPDKDMITGTPPYISPEQVQGVEDLDCRSDMYALGSTLYHMLTGRLPFADTSGMETMGRQLNDYLQDPVDIRPEISHPAVWLIEKMMAKDRTLRHRNWDEVLRDIEAVLAGKMPAGEPLPAGASTVRRSKKRKLPAQVAPRKPVKVVAPPGSPKKKVVLKPGASPMPVQSEKPANPMPGAVGRLVVLAVVTAVLYVGVFLIIPARRAALRSAPADEEVTAPQMGKKDVANRFPHSISPSAVSKELRAPQEDAEFTVAEDDSELDPAEFEPGTRKQAGKWKNPTFVDGAKAFNRALDDYKRCQTGELPNSALKKVEEDFRYAIDQFNEVKHRAPDDVPITEYIRQSYELISACRHFTLLGPEAAAEKKQKMKKKPKAKKATSAADEFLQFADDELQEKAEGRGSAREGDVGGGLKLSLNWDAGVSGAKRQIVEDLQNALANRARPNVDFAPKPEHVIFEGITYLMPAVQAASVLGASLSARNPVTNPGFPRASFSYYSLTGEFGNSFDTILLMVDKEDKVAGIQLVSLKSQPKPALSHGFFNGETKTYNHLQSRFVKGNQQKVGVRTMVKGGNVIIDNELIAASDFKSLGRTRLILPQPVADIISHRLSTK